MNFRSFSTLQIALGVSIAVHAVLLTVRFVDPEGFNRIFQDTPLEVILVNAKGAEKPDPAKAKAIAQHTLAGGGDAEKGRATTPLPASALTELGDSPEDAQRKIEATREEVYAVYYDRLRRKIEDKGTENFPTAAGRKLYGELTMILTVNRDGRVIDVEVVQTSGSLTLDRRAMAIARSAAPFGRFNEAMRRQADQIVVVSRFRFTRDETLETNLTSR